MACKQSRMSEVIQRLRVITQIEEVSGTSNHRSISIDRHWLEFTGPREDDDNDNNNTTNSTDDTTNEECSKITNQRRV
jgi:hypothetical protein